MSRPSSPTYPPTTPPLPPHYPVQVPVPDGTRAKDVICVISKQKISLSLRGGEREIVSGIYPCDARNGKEVWEQVRCDESTWSLGERKGEGGSKQLVVSIYLEKERESWWKSALDGDPEIDTQKVDSTRSMYEYDGETQASSTHSALFLTSFTPSLHVTHTPPMYPTRIFGFQGAIRKIMFDQHQKRRGLPNSEEINQARVSPCSPHVTLPAFLYVCVCVCMCVCIYNIYTGGDFTQGVGC